MKPKGITEGKEPKCSGKTVIISGATGAIGGATSRAFLAEGAHVILLARSAKKATALQEELQSAYPNAKVNFVQADMEDFSSLRHVPEKIQAIADHLDVFVHAAGVIKFERELREDGLERIFAGHYLGYFLLTHLLLPLIPAKSSSAIVAVTSEAFTTIDFENLQSEKSFGPIKTFAQATACKNAFTLALGDVLAIKKIRVYAFHPGFVRNEIQKQMPGIAGLIGKILAPFAKAPENSANAIVELISSQEYEQIQSGFFRLTKLSKPPKHESSPNLQRKLWDLSNKLLGTSY